jgi:hypothetical protein
VPVTALQSLQTCQVAMVAHGLVEQSK